MKYLIYAGILLAMTGPSYGITFTNSGQNNYIDVNVSTVNTTTGKSNDLFLNNVKIDPGESGSRPIFDKLSKIRNDLRGKLQNERVDITVYAKVQGVNVSNVHCTILTINGHKSDKDLKSIASGNVIFTNTDCNLVPQGK